MSQSYAVIVHRASLDDDPPLVRAFGPYEHDEALGVAMSIHEAIVQAVDIVIEPMRGWTGALS